MAERGETLPSTPSPRIEKPEFRTAKLGATDGHSFRHLAAVMTGSTQDDYAKMMLEGGRSVEGNRSKSGKYDKPATKAAAKPAKPKAKAQSKPKKKRK